MGQTTGVDDLDEVVGQQRRHRQGQIERRTLVGQQRVHRQGAEPDGAHEPDERASG